MLKVFYHIYGRYLMKTLIAAIRILINLISYNKELKKAQQLNKEGKIAERDAFVNPLVQQWAKFIIGITGKNTTVSVTGTENIPKDSACVFIGNHQGYFDIPLLLSCVNKPIAFIAKKEIKKVPFLNKWMDLMQCTFLDRNNPRQTVQAMAEAVENVKKGYSLVIFPEGHRSKGKPMQDFKPGSFKLAFRSEAPIVPVTIDGTWKLFEEKGLRSADLRLIIHPPVETKGLTREEQAELPAKIQKTIADAL